jgi:hypothetical protein
MNINIEIKKSYLVVLAVFLLIGIVYAAVDESLPWHSSSQVKLSNGEDLETAFSDLNSSFDTFKQELLDGGLDNFRIIRCVETITSLDYLGDTEGCKIRVNCDDGRAETVWNEFGSFNYRNSVSLASQDCWNHMKATADTIPRLDPTFLGSTGVTDEGTQYDAGRGRRIYYLSGIKDLKA